MCNLNILITKKRNRQITPFLMAVTSHSFARNNDGEGIYIKSIDKIIKSKSKINYFDYQKDIETSDIVITHQRLSTSGFEIDFNHPFENKEFVMVHNGIINQFKRNEGSDTYGFWLSFNESMMPITSLNKSDRDDRIRKSIKKLFKDDSGSYSIFIYDKKTKQSYYFKNDSTSINFYKNDDYLFITTNDDNKTFLEMLSDNKFIELDIKPRTVYLIELDKEVYKIFNLSQSKKLSFTFKEYSKKFYQLCDSCGQIIPNKCFKSSIDPELTLCESCHNGEDNYDYSDSRWWRKIK